MRPTQASILRPQTSVSTSYHVISRMYLVILVLILSSTGKCDPPPSDDFTASTQIDVTTQTTAYSSFWSVDDETFQKNTRIVTETTRKSLTSSENVYSHNNKMKTSSAASSSLQISTNADLERKEYPMTKVTTHVDDRITTSELQSTGGGFYDVTLQTTSGPAPEIEANACDTDQLDVTNIPLNINASTNDTQCSLLVNAPNRTAISISVLPSHLNNVHTYFYLEKLENQLAKSPERISLVSLDHTPCVAMIQGTRFRFHFQNTKMKVVICTTEVETSACYGTVRPLIEATQCGITLYESKIQTSQWREYFSYGSGMMIVTHYQAKCTCDCPDTCICTLAYRQWLSVCINSQDSNTTRANLIVYKPTIEVLSFANTGLNEIQHNAFAGLVGVRALILSHNNLLMFQITVCQNLPKLQVLKLHNNKLVNLTSDSFKGPCDQQLKMLDLQSNELTYLPHDLFNSTTNLTYLGLKQNRLVQVSSDLFKSLKPLFKLYLDDNAISNLTMGVFDSLGELRLLHLSGNDISNLPVSVFDSLGRLRTLDLSGNDISNLPLGVFDSLGRLWYLYLSGNDISNLPLGVFDSLGVLYNLNLSGNDISNLPLGVFDSLGGLRTLDLSSNDISNLTMGVFHSLVALRILDLSSNDICNLPLGVFDSLGWLLTLDLSGNNISNLPVGVFDSIGRLLTLDLSSNDISNLPVGVFDSIGRLDNLDLSGNNISNLPLGVFDSLGRLITLDLSGNDISNLPLGVFHSLIQLITLDLSDNLIPFLPDNVVISVGSETVPWLDTPGLKTLNLNGNNISKLYANVFQSLTGLFTLAISHNSLHTLPMDAFNALLELKTLDLSNNRIKMLPSTVLKSQRYLLTLDLSNNELFVLSGELFLMLNNLISLNLCCNNLTISDPQTFESLTQLKILDISKNSIEEFPPQLFEFTANLLSLEISQNKLRKVLSTLFRNLSKLTYLNMSKNSLSKLPSFNAQGQLQVLDISKNRLTTIKRITFENLKSLTLLSIAQNSITALHSHMFFNLDNIEFINVSFNALQKIDSKVVRDKTKLKTFDLRGNEMYKVTTDSFSSMTSTTILVDKHATCCFLNEEKCISMTPRLEYLTCNRMLRDIVLRVSVWVLGLSAFICNVIAYCVRSRKRKANKVQTLLISHLALSDLLMGVNMLILAIADVNYGQYFPSYTHVWRQGFTCKFAGFLSILSSEGSVFFITLISMDRMLGIKYPFGGHRLETNSARICVALAWLTALLISIIPISLASDNGNFYSISEVCIGIPIVRRHFTKLVNKSSEITTSTISSSPDFHTAYRVNYGEKRYINRYVRDVQVMHQESAQNITYTIAENAGSQVASIYSIVVFISVNCFCFVTVACCYMYIFIKATSSAEGASRAQTPQQARDEDLRMARKMFAIVFTDFCCWVPLNFVCILTQSGVIEVSPEMYAWTVGFILPINSSINPFLYVLYETISDHLKKKREKRKTREEIEMQVRWKPLKSFGLRFDENK